MRFFSSTSSLSRAAAVIRSNPSFSKLLLAATVSGGGVFAYAYADSGSDHVSKVELHHNKKKVVVLGTGWAATSFLKDLDSSLYDVQIVSPCNYFAFTPLLPCVTCGTVDARSIVEPIRKIMKKDGDIRFREAECFEIDPANKEIHCRSSMGTNLDGNGEFVISYDYLVVAVGAQVNTFNTPGVVDHCHFLKEVEDAQRILRSVIDCFERADLPDLSEEERQRHLHFVVVGGGPTGIEFAAELHDFVHDDFAKLYPKTNRRVLATDEWLKVQGCNDVYALGDCATISQCKIMVELYLKYKHMDDIFDLLYDSKGNLKNDSMEVNIEEFKKAFAYVDSQVKNLPATLRLLLNKELILPNASNHMPKVVQKPEGPVRIGEPGHHLFHPFRYKHFGQFTPLGGEQTAAELPGDWVSMGYGSQWLWYSVYASKQVSWRTRVAVVSDWARRFIFGRDSSHI